MLELHKFDVKTYCLKPLSTLISFSDRIYSQRSLLPKATHDLGLKTSIQNFDAFIRCTLMGNQPWPQFQNGIRERSISKVIGHFD